MTIGRKDTLTYDKRNKDEAIACALQVALEITASKQSKSMSNDSVDDNEEMMQSAHEPLLD